MNSLGATPRVKYIYEDLKDGLAIIQVCLLLELNLISNFGRDSVVSTLLLLSNFV